MSSLIKTLGRLPKHIDFAEQNGVLTMKISHSGAISNMQEDNSAFEAWALYIKAKGFEQILLDDNTNIEDLDVSEQRHYNRFMYRALRFSEGFEWFALSDRLHEKVEQFNTIELSRSDLFVNAPLSTPGEADEKSHEAKIERLLVEDNHIEQMRNMLGESAAKVKRFYNQLPVGLFGERVTSHHAIFPRNGAAIDIWGLDGSTFHLVELKVKGNRKLGVLSEVFFYTCFMRDMYCDKRLECKDPKDLRRHKRNGEFPNGHTELVNAKINNVVAYILTEQRHPHLDLAYSVLQKCSLQGMNFAMDVRALKVEIKQDGVSFEV